jgi:hypothetical protein
MSIAISTGTGSGYFTDRDDEEHEVSVYGKFNWFIRIKISSHSFYPAGSIVATGILAVEPNFIIDGGISLCLSFDDGNIVAYCGDSVIPMAVSQTGAIQILNGIMRVARSPAMGTQYSFQIDNQVGIQTGMTISKIRIFGKALTHNEYKEVS